jgi:hypothetical protein
MFHTYNKNTPQLSQDIPVQAWIGPEGSRRLRIPGCFDRRYRKETKSSALRTGSLYLPGKIPGNHFSNRLSWPQGHRATGRIKSMKNLKDPIGNRACDLLTSSAAPQPTAPPRAPYGN